MRQLQQRPSVVDEESHPSLRIFSTDNGDEGPRVTMRFGAHIEVDDRLAAQRDREQYFLTIVIPRYATWHNAFVDLFVRSIRPNVYVPLLVIVAVHVGAAVGCTGVEALDVCAGGPLDDEDDEALAAADGSERFHIMLISLLSRTFRSYAFQQYGPAVLSMLATLMLSFYANVCVSLYREAYLSCQVLKESTLDLNALAVGTTRGDAAAVRMEFWRCINLFHLCSYVIADKTRRTYSFDNFLVPVATAFGPWDGQEHLGMLTLSEMVALTAQMDATEEGGFFAPARCSAYNAATANSTARMSMRDTRGKAGGGHAAAASAAAHASRLPPRPRQSQVLRSVLNEERHTDTEFNSLKRQCTRVRRESLANASSLFKAPTPGGGGLLGRVGSVPHGAGATPLNQSQTSCFSSSLHLGAGSRLAGSSSRSHDPPPSKAKVPMAHSPSGGSQPGADDDDDDEEEAPSPFGLANVQGDVSSVPAALHAALGIRLYKLVDFMIDEKLSRASWPAWNAVLLKLRASSEAMKHRALYRLPRIYRSAVWFLVATALLTDTFILGSRTARLLGGASRHSEWRAHAYFGAVLGLLLNVILSWFVTLLLLALSNMENPFGKEWLDLCGLCNAISAAEMSLKMVVGAEESLDPAFERAGPASRVMHMFQQLDTASLRSRRKKADKDDEEEEADDDDGGGE
jgi:hypothetical protein